MARRVQPPHAGHMPNAPVPVRARDLPSLLGLFCLLTLVLAAAWLFDVESARCVPRTVRPDVSTFPVCRAAPEESPAPTGSDPLPR